MTDFYHRGQVKARKQHTCSDCHRVICPGEMYERCAGMDGSRAWTWKDCAHCIALLTQLRQLDLVWDDEYSEHTFVDWQPETVEQARWKAQWKRQWRRRDGQLYTMPGIDVA